MIGYCFLVRFESGMMLNCRWYGVYGKYILDDTLKKIIIGNMYFIIYFSFFEMWNGELIKVIIFYRNRIGSGGRGGWWVGG